MSILLHNDVTAANEMCIGIYDFEPPAGDKMDQHISAYACNYAQDAYNKYNARRLDENPPPSAIMPPPVKHTWSRVETLPQSYASYPLGSVLCLQVDPNTVAIRMVVDKDVGWVRTLVRHRTIELGTLRFIPIRNDALITYTRARMSAIAQAQTQQSHLLENECVRLAEQNEFLEERCAKLLQAARGVVGDKVAFGIVGTEHKMSYTPLTMTESAT